MVLPLVVFHESIAYHQPTTLPELLMRNIIASYVDLESLFTKGAFQDGSPARSFQ